MNHTSQHVCTHPRKRARQERALERLIARTVPPRGHKYPLTWAEHREREIDILKSKLGVA